MDWVIAISLYRRTLKNTLGQLRFSQDCKDCQQNESALAEYKEKHL